MDVMENIQNRQILDAEPTLNVLKGNNNGAPVGMPTLDPIKMNDNPTAMISNIEEVPILLNLPSLKDDSSTSNLKEIKTSSGKILYCQFCILPTNTEGFQIN